ncbi:type II toxin-antitoxin system RelE/ParE family toxin [Paraneptunicella aestuarii]|uniref:type II toxin-antitoxin system RelE/ParE family toxin n=1 Tax=Paraneptunicella aestuarii TaxID=2831148 RepID=UPI001E493A99|nr:type II toxin-antitoxin system RelE/ParE family toxin [Paraneptunicella aestuarii]UAA37609.1 type II toxin-antitoxin system RelE/ParE family toxin [Paraneptunicella aestuarii]
MTTYLLSPAAQASLKNIKAYSLENFGTIQTRHYLKSLRERMQALAENPERGRIRDELKVGFYSDFIGSHTIYYRIKPPHIEIIDVLHQSMDPSKHVE